MLEITAMDDILRLCQILEHILGISYFTRNNASTIAKAQMLNKPYIHYIDIKL